MILAASMGFEGQSYNWHQVQGKRSQRWYSIVCGSSKLPTLQLCHGTVTSVSYISMKSLCSHDRLVSEFDVHGSVHLGNVYVQLKVQLDVHVFICIS
jgi:hypothetical protein